MQRYNPKDIESKWQQTWADQGIYNAVDFDERPKYVMLTEFPYPSGSGMHIGHIREYTYGDMLARFKRMQGYNVLYPMGYDAFGLPTENFAIKNKISPQKATDDNTANFTRQLNRMGYSFDWSRSFKTSDPDYYKWTQWLFLKFVEAGLAYQAEIAINWCPFEKTGLANEEVVNGRHERCGTLVEKKLLKQWLLRITEYADRLIDGLQDVDYPSRIADQQINWIGRSKGAEVRFIVPRTPDFDPTSYEFNEHADFNQFTPAAGQAVATTYYAAGEPHRQVGDTFQVGDPETGQHTGIVRITATDAIKLGDLREDSQKVILEHEPELTLDALFTKYEYEIVADIIPIFTTRPDTIFGATFLVLAPEHPAVAQLTTKEQKAEVDTYIKAAQAKSDVERQDTDREKTGVFTGAYATNPANGEQVPIWIADYVLTGYGTGAIMAVPAHDERDGAFAQKFGLPLKPVIAPLFGEYLPEVTDRPAIVILAKDAQTGAYCALNWTKDMPQKPKGFELPGGGIDEGEDIMAAAKRELIEETGYTDVTIDEILPAATVQYYTAVTDGRQRRQVRYVALATVHSLAHNGVTGTEDYEKGNYTVEWLTKDQIRANFTGMWAKTAEYAFDSPIFTDKEGVMINSGAYDNLTAAEARDKIVADLAAKGIATEKVNYRLRDWVFSRQHYWGEPIPIIHCPEHGAVPVPADQLPVTLPDVEAYEPTDTGESPLAAITDWVNTICPTCGGPAKRETDTMPNWAGSSWYYLRYFDAHNDSAFADRNKMDYWQNVDLYLGGMEHTTLHLLYSRFWHQFFYDQGLVPTPEPYTARRGQGIILAADGSKMSKSKGNVVDPIEVIDSGYGADALRLTIAFLAPYDQTTPWSPESVAGTYRYINRLWNLTQEYQAAGFNSIAEQPDVLRVAHKTIKRVTEDLHNLGFNTAIAGLMEAVNELYKLKEQGFKDRAAWQFAIKSLLQISAPFAPHATEELWQQLGHAGSIHTSSWPTFDEKYLQQDTVTYAVQVNGKLRGQVSVPADADQATVMAAAQADDKVKIYLEGQDIKKTIVVPGKLISFVV